MSVIPHFDILESDLKKSSGFQIDYKEIVKARNQTIVEECTA